MRPCSLCTVWTLTLVLIVKFRCKLWKTPPFHTLCSLNRNRCDFIWGCFNPPNASCHNSITWSWSFKEMHPGLISSEPSPCPFSARLSDPLLPTNPLTLFSYSNPLAPSPQIPVSTNQPENTTLPSKVTKCPSSCSDQRTFCQWAADEFGTRGSRLRAIAGSTKTMAPIFANVARRAKWKFNCVPPQEAP